MTDRIGGPGFVWESLNPLDEPTLLERAAIAALSGLCAGTAEAMNKSRSDSLAAVAVSHAEALVRALDRRERE